MGLKLDRTFAPDGNRLVRSWAVVGRVRSEAGASTRVELSDGSTVRNARVVPGRVMRAWLRVGAAF